MSAINRSILWKLIITALVVIWAVSAMIPFSDTPFETYIQTRATANQEEFAKILKAAEARVDKLAAKTTNLSRRPSISHSATTPTPKISTFTNIFRTSTYPTFST